MVDKPEIDPLALIELCQQRVNAQIDVLNAAPNRDIAAKEAAILGAVSSRETWAVVLGAVKTLVTELHGAGEALSRTDTSTKRLADWTRRLVFATWALAGAAIVAALIGWHVASTIPPQIIPVSAPPAPPVVITPAPIALPPTPPKK